jgi:hypothetical protein
MPKSLRSIQTYGRAGEPLSPCHITPSAKTRTSLFLSSVVPWLRLQISALCVRHPRRVRQARGRHLRGAPSNAAPGAAPSSGTGSWVRNRSGPSPAHTARMTPPHRTGERAHVRSRETARAVSPDAPARSQRMSARSSCTATCPASHAAPRAAGRRCCHRASDKGRAEDASRSTKEIWVILAKTILLTVSHKA